MVRFSEPGVYVSFAMLVWDSVHPKTMLAWAGILPALPAIGIAVTGIIWMALTASSLWRNALSSALFLVALALTCTSLASFVCTLLSLVFTDTAILPSLQIVTAIFSFAFSFVSLSLSTQSYGSRYVDGITDYCANFGQDIEFCRTATPWTISRFVTKRTVLPFSLISGFLSLWISLFAGNIVLNKFVPPGPRRAEALELSTLPMSSLDAPAAQQRRESHDDEPMSKLHVQDPAEPGSGSQDP